ncbi:MAG: CDP-alcohol phosphatidyltransferase family protein, partial [Pseudomonadota bacterium]
LVPEAVAAHRGAIVALAALALALDGVDGWLARRAGLVSDFGARFDMEVDCILAAILALLLLRTVDGAFVVPALLVLGFARYAFVVAAWMWPWLRGDLPDRISRKAVCVAQIGALIAVLAMPALAPILPLAALAVLWSFARDVRWLARRR